MTAPYQKIEVIATAHYEVGRRPHSHWETKQFDAKWKAQKFCEEWRDKNPGGAWFETHLK